MSTFQIFIWQLSCSVSITSWPLLASNFQLFSINSLAIQPQERLSLLQPQHGLIRLHHLNLFFLQQLGHSASFVSSPFGHSTSKVSLTLWPQHIDFSILTARPFGLIYALAYYDLNLSTFQSWQFDHYTSFSSWPLLASTGWLFYLISSSVQP